MVKLLFFKMLRDMRRSAATYLICIAVIATGFCGFSVLSLASGSLSSSRDQFFADTAFGDVFAEVYEAPASAVRRLEQIPGVRRAQARLTKTVRVTGLPAGEAELQLISVQQGGLNLPLLSRGRMPREGARELVVGDAFLEAHGLKAGDELTLAINGRRVPYVLCGSGISPESIYMVKSIADLLPSPLKYDAAFLDYTALAQAFGRAGYANGFVLALEPGYTAEAVEREVRAALEPYGCHSYYGRDKQISVSMLGQELTSLDKMSTVIPFLFLMVSAVILYITLRRLIDQQRTQIGTLMASGLPLKTVMLHYMWYGAFTGLCGGLLGGAETRRLASLTAFGEALGLAFQIVDDILDVTQDTATLGKPAGSDAASGKITYPVLLGLNRSRELASEAAEQAVVCLADESGPDAAFLCGLARLLVHRIN